LIIAAGVFGTVYAVRKEKVGRKNYGALATRSQRKKKE